MEQIILFSILVFGLLFIYFLWLKEEFKVNKKIIYREKLLIKYLEYKVDDLEEARAMKMLGLKK